MRLFNDINDDNVNSDQQRDLHLYYKSNVKSNSMSVCHTNCWGC